MKVRFDRREVDVKVELDSSDNLMYDAVGELYVRTMKHQDKLTEDFFAGNVLTIRWQATTAYRFVFQNVRVVEAKYKMGGGLVFGFQVWRTLNQSFCVERTSNRSPYLEIEG